MKQARDIYQDLAALPDEAAMIDALTKLKGRELHALHHYALGREPGDTRDRIMICLLMEAGDRHLARLAAKQAKRTKRTF